MSVIGSKPDPFMPSDDGKRVKGGKNEKRQAMRLPKGESLLPVSKTPPHSAWKVGVIDKSPLQNKAKPTSTPPKYTHQPPVSEPATKATRTADKAMQKPTRVQSPVSKTDELYDATLASMYDLTHEVGKSRGSLQEAYSELKESGDLYTSSRPEYLAALEEECQSIDTKLTSMIVTVKQLLDGPQGNKGQLRELLAGLEDGKTKIVQFKKELEVEGKTLPYQTRTELHPMDKKRMGCGIANPGINACYLNSTLQAMRLCSSFKHFISREAAAIDMRRYSPETVSSASLKEQCISIAKLPPSQRCAVWTAIVQAGKNQAQVLRNELTVRSGPVFNQYPGLSMQNKSALIGCLNDACDRNLPQENLKARLTHILKQSQVPQGNRNELIDQLISVSQAAKAETVANSAHFLAQHIKNPQHNDAAAKLLQLPKDARAECLRDSLVIQLKELYDILEGSNNKPQDTASMDVIQSIRQLSRLCGFEAKGATSQEDAHEFLSHLLDSVSAPTFTSFSFDERTSNLQNNSGRFLELGIGETGQKGATDMQSIIDTVDRRELHSKSIPDVLPIQLKRYEFDQNGQIAKNTRSVAASPTIEVAVQDDPPKKVKYNLQAIVVHSGGSPDSGHYFTYVPKVINGKEVWLEYNDQGVYEHKYSHRTPPGLENGYLFIYEKSR